MEGCGRFNRRISKSPGELLHGQPESHSQRGANLTGHWITYWWCSSSDSKQAIMERQPDVNLPRSIKDKPELHLVWKGLMISIGAGQMTRGEAYAMLEGWNTEDDPPDNQDSSLAA